MTTKQILISTLILGSIGNNALATKDIATDKVFNDEWYNKLNDTYISLAILDPRITELDNIKVIEKWHSSRFVARGTIGSLKKHQDGEIQLATLKTIASKNAIACSHGTIILDSTDPNDCETVRNEYEELEGNGFLQEKNNQTK